MGDQMLVAHRTYPVLTGLGVAAALLLTRWFPSPRLIPFVALPFVIAVPLGVLGTAPRGEVPPLRIRHCAAGSLAVLIAIGLALMAAYLTRGLESLIGNTHDVESVEFTAVIASVGITAGWFAGQLERWADRDRGPRFLPRSRGDPRSWGVAGVAGVSIFLATSMVWAWVFALAPGLEGLGPTGPATGAYAVAAGVVGVLGLVAGLTLEAARARRHRGRQET